jgi:NADH-quinone oxidoreductase subunit L
MNLLLWAWLFAIPGLVLTSVGTPSQRRYAGYASMAGPPVILVVALVALISGGSQTVQIPNWLPFLPDGAFSTLADGLSALMLVILGFVATAVYVYTLGYMADDPGRRRFFVYLDLFVISMSLLVLAGNLAVVLIGWTGVGISSFLLISFWRDRPGTLGAGLQALAANAIGDGALLLAAALQPAGCGSLVTLGQGACANGPLANWPEWLALLLFIAAAAKSAQGPLYFWLPNAMAGPTPISALIHAATMVAAGVYLLVRTHALLVEAPTVSMWIAIVGVATAVGASIGSLFQSNFKKGIAYSTVAQLGYMFAAVGVGAPFAGLFHLFTHASFKALLFLAAGVVIHGTGGRESLDALRGLGRYFPLSRAGFLVGALALIGTPLITAGSFSKDAIIDAAIANPSLSILGWLLLASVILTGLYIGRLFTIVYVAEPPDAERHAVHHDASSERLMDWSLVPLAIGAIVFGYAGSYLATVLSGPLGEVEPLPSLLDPRGWIAFALGAIGFGLAYWFVLRQPARAAVERAPSYAAHPWVRAIADGGYALAAAVSRAHVGALANYALGSFVGVALILLVRVMVR